MIMGNKESNFKKYKKEKFLPVGPNNEGKIPPQAVELEESVLGAIMLDKEAFNEVCGILEANHFYKESHREIFEAMWSLFRKSEPIDLLTVTQELRDNGNIDMVGGAYFITQLTTRLTSAANVEFHARIVREKFMAREIIRISTNALRNAYEETQDIFELISEIETEYFQLTNNLGQLNASMIGDIYTNIVDDIFNFDPSIQTVATSTGSQELDNCIMGGLRKPNLITLAGRTSMGKTTYALNIAKHVALDLKKPLAIYSYEMSKQELVTNIISNVAGIPSEKITMMDKSVLDILMRNNIRDTILEGQLYIEDSGTLNIVALRSSLKKLKAKYNIEGFIVDYLQLMPNLSGSSSKTREGDVSENSKGLKRVCKELQLWCIDLSQLSRQVENRPGNLPRLSDLRESGSIEQDSDKVIFIFRPEYYGITTFDDGESTIGMAEIIIAKQRNGPLKTIRVRFNKTLGRFEDQGTSTIYLPPPPEPPTGEDEAMF